MKNLWKNFFPNFNLSKKKRPHIEAVFNKFQTKLE